MLFAMCSSLGIMFIILYYKEMGHTSSDCEVMKYSSGKAFPLGVSQVEGGLNFAIFSQHASSVTLCLKLPERYIFAPKTVL